MLRPCVRASSSYLRGLIGQCGKWPLDRGSAECALPPASSPQVLNLLLNSSSACFERCDVGSADTSTSTSSTPNGHSHSRGGSAPKFRPVPGLHVPYLSLGMLHSLLAEFAEAGGQVAWLHQVRVYVCVCGCVLAAVRVGSDVGCAAATEGLEHLGPPAARHAAPPRGQPLAPALLLHAPETHCCALHAPKQQ